MNDCHQIRKKPIIERPVFSFVILSFLLFLTYQPLKVYVFVGRWKTLLINYLIVIMEIWVPTYGSYFLYQDDCSKNERGTENTAFKSDKIDLPGDILHVGIR